MYIKTWVILGLAYVVIIFAAYGWITGNNPFQNEGFDDHEQHSNGDVQIEKIDNYTENIQINEVA